MNGKERKWKVNKTLGTGVAPRRMRAAFFEGNIGAVASFPKAEATELVSSVGFMRGVSPCAGVACGREGGGVVGRGSCFCGEISCAVAMLPKSTEGGVVARSGGVMLRVRDE